jgi:RNA polymerase sigma-70 factor (ECF subfamily)
MNGPDMDGVSITVAVAAAERQLGIIKRARDGDRAAFEALVGPRVDGLFRTAWAILGNEADARDATQEACLSAWQHLPRLRDIDSFDAWLGRILLNSCRMLLRRRRHRVGEITIPDDFDRPSTGPAATDSVGEVELISRAFDRLDPAARSLLVLHHLRHEPVERIAATLAIPVGTVKWRLHAARQALERALEGERR